MHMSKHIIDITGKKFGKFTVIEFAGIVQRKYGKYSIWKCRCDCGKIKILKPSYLKRKNRPVTCGCSYQDRSKEIFHSNYEKTEGCWEWKGVIGMRGYGKIGAKGLAHRRSYEYAFGKIPEGMQICHKCDNKKCVNPEHLFLGSISDNLKDMTEKGRRARGSKIGNSILDEKKVLEIREKRLNGQTFQSLSEEYNISWYLVRCICKNRQWKHVPLGYECNKYISPHDRNARQRIG